MGCAVAACVGAGLYACHWSAVEEAGEGSEGEDADLDSEDDLERVHRVRGWSSLLVGAVVYGAVVAA